MSPEDSDDGAEWEEEQDYPEEHAATEDETGAIAESESTGRNLFSVKKANKKNPKYLNKTYWVIPISPEGSEEGEEWEDTYKQDYPSDEDAATEEAADEADDIAQDENSGRKLIRNLSEKKVKSQKSQRRPKKTVIEWYSDFRLSKIHNQTLIYLFVIVLCSPRPYLSRNRRAITWMSNYRYPIWTFWDDMR